MAITIDGTNGLSSDNAALKLDGTTLVVDETNNRVGVGTASPAVAMDVVGQVRASTGILFGSDTAATNALDDYEEGTWTPAFGSSGGPSTGGSTTVTAATYTKIGRFVFASCDITIATKGSLNGADTARLHGLPFTSNSSQSGGASVNLFLNLNQNVTFLSGTVQDSATDILFRVTTSSTSSQSNATWTNLYQNTTRLMLSITYQTP